MADGKNLPFQPVGNSNVSGVVGSTAETTVLTLKNDPNLMVGSSYSFFYIVTLGSNTEIDLRYYAAFINGTPGASDWYELPFKSVASGVATVSDSYSKVTGPLLQFVDIFSTGNSAFQFPAASALKITAKGNSASNNGGVTVNAFLINH